MKDNGLCIMHVFVCKQWNYGRGEKGGDQLYCTTIQVIILNDMVAY